jgi:hypothetical protein
MKTFKTFLIEEILRRPDKETMKTLQRSGTFQPKSGESIRLTVYHGGHFGEAEGEMPNRDMISFPETSNRWNSVKNDERVTTVRGQPGSSGLGLSTTPDAIAAREYRDMGRGAAVHTSDNFKAPHLGRLYEIDLSIKPERYRHFHDFHEMENFIDKHINHPDYKKWSDDNNHLMTDWVHDAKRRKYLTDVIGVDAIGVNNGTARAHSAGEVLILNRDIVHGIRNQTENVDRVRERMSKAREYATVPGNIPVVDRIRRIKNSMGKFMPSGRDGDLINRSYDFNNLKDRSRRPKPTG